MCLRAKRSTQSGLGHKIEAINAYRAIHGVGLKDAKEAVERLAKRLDTERKGA